MGEPFTELLLVLMQFSCQYEAGSRSWTSSYAPSYEWDTSRKGADKGTPAIRPPNRAK
jgi:hypothetical protein